MTPLLLALPGNEDFSRRLAAHTRWELGTLAVRSFPDGETHLRVDSDCRGRSAVLVCTLDRPDAKLLPLLFAASTLRELGAARVGLVAPYLAYMRQDRRFQPGEAVTSRIFARVLGAELSWLITVDPHLHRFRGLGELYSIPTRVVHAAPALAAWIAAEVEAPLLVGPDQESEQWIADVAGRIGAPHVVLTKTRRGDEDVVVSAPQVERFSGRTPVVLDDIVSSAHTMAEAVYPLGALTGRGVVCVGVHGIFAGNAQRLLLDAGAARVVTTTTVRHETNRIDVSPLLVPALAELATAPRS